VIRTEDTTREPGGVERGLTVRGERLTRLSVTAITAVIALLTFAFSFGNVWQLGRRLGIAAWMAPLVGPSVDLSVVGLLVAVRHLSMHGIPSGQLRAPRVLLVWCGLVMLALNVSEPIATGRYAAAAFDSVAPLLLIGWSEVGPKLLRQIHAVGRRSEPVADRPDSEPLVDRDAVTAWGGPEGFETALLAAARQIDADHRRRCGRPIAADTLRRELRIGAARARTLTSWLRTNPLGQDEREHQPGPLKGDTQ
jgi:Protein of unknown function (DUF2637)